MSKIFYLEEEENEKEESISKYNDLFEKYINNKPALNIALYEMYILSNLSKEKAIDLTNDILQKCKNWVDLNLAQITNKYQNISRDDAFIITSYTCESKEPNYSPYKILNNNLVSNNRKNGLKIISKYFFILLYTLRKLPRYYPIQTKGYLFRCINKQINYKIDPFNPRAIPYMQGNRKTFWGFTSTSPNIKMSYNFLGKKEHFKSGTIFSLYGDLWGYDITLFNFYNEDEILLEPERKFIIKQILPPVNEIIYITCKIEESPQVLNNISKSGQIQISPIINQIIPIQNQIPQIKSILNLNNINNNNSSKSSRNFFVPKNIGLINTNKNINIKFFHSYQIDILKDYQISSQNLSSNLFSLLKLCLLKEIANKINFDDLYKLPESLNIIMRTLKNNYLYQTQDIQKDIRNAINYTGDNILNFSKFVNNEVKPAQIDDLIKYIQKSQNYEMQVIVNKLVKYEYEIKLFNKEFLLALKNSIFEFSLVSAVIIERYDFERFKQEREKCPNRVDRVLFYGTSPYPISCILTSHFKKTSGRLCQHGEGVYLNDKIDYCWFYGNSDSNRANKNKIPLKGEEFTMLGCSVYYDKTGFHRVNDSLYTPKKNEINSAYVDPNLRGIINPEEHKIFFNEYVIWDLDQICPFLSMKLKREEYCVIWRDIYYSTKQINNKPIDEKIKKFLYNQLNNVEQNVNFNVYPCSSTEEALALVKRKRYNKIILISNVGNDFGGIIFINEARKIIGNNVVALFFVYNIEKHLGWITKYKNALVTKEPSFLERYMQCFNGISSKDIMTGIWKLKEEFEQKYIVKLNFSLDFLNYPNYKDSGYYTDLYI